MCEARFIHITSSAFCLPRFLSVCYLCQVLGVYYICVFLTFLIALCSEHVGRGLAVNFFTMVNWFHLSVLAVTLLLIMFSHHIAADRVNTVKHNSIGDKRVFRSVHPIDNKTEKNLKQKSLMLLGNKTKTISINGSYSVEEETPTQSLRNTGQSKTPPQSPVEEGVNEEQPKELPIALIIASPVVAVFIIVFVCVAYYCHSAQLDARARELAMRLKADEEMAQVMVQPPRPVVVAQDNTDMEAEHTSLRSVKTQTSSESKRGSVIEDREVIKYSRTRRHSTFII